MHEWANVLISIVSSLVGAAALYGGIRADLKNNIRTGERHDEEIIEINRKLFNHISTHK